MSVTTELLNGIAYLAFEDKLPFLLDELQNRFGIKHADLQVYGNLVYTEKKLESYPFWCATVLFKPAVLNFHSVNDAANALRQIQRNWASYQYVLFRRAALIEEKLPYINTKPKSFPFEIPQKPIGIWTLLDEHKMLFSAETSSYLPCGNLGFVEDHENPPSRAYLKLQNALVLFNSFFGRMPKAGDVCFDAGACPGGWTWVLLQAGCSVFAVDRAELAPALMSDPAVTFLKHDAFTLKPADLQDFDWIFSDVICYPERLLEWIKMWLEQDVKADMICTIKMQGETDWNLIEEFERLPDSKVIHLSYNKHELTWMHRGNK